MVWVEVNHEVATRGARTLYTQNTFFGAITRTKLVIMLLGTARAPTCRSLSRHVRCRHNIDHGAKHAADGYLCIP